MEVRLFDKLFQSEVSDLGSIDHLFFQNGAGGLHDLGICILNTDSYCYQNPAELEDWLGDMNPHSKAVISDAYGVPALRDAAVGDKFQFERLG